MVLNREFTWFVIARFLFIAGLRMTPVLLGWKLYEVTGSKLSIGLLGLSEVIPAVLFALPAGVKVDRSNKHKLISICMALYFLLMIGLLVVTSQWFTSEVSSPGKTSSRQLIQWLIYGLVFCTGIIRAYTSPAINAFLAQLVPQESLVRAVSINSMTWLIAAVAGPAMA
ncbi:MAG TPA: MFS transporter, partial [Chitinophagaceae bacterium]|nr:MFS transporter [Chitinophagaceae bacterium]